MNKLIRDLAFARSQELVERAQLEDRDLTASEQKEFNELLGEVSAWDTPVRRSKPIKSTNVPPGFPASRGDTRWEKQPDRDGIGTDSGATLFGYDKKSGAPILSFGSNSSMLQWLREQAEENPRMFRSLANPHLVGQLEPNMAGRWIEARLFGDWRNAEDIRAALGEGVNSSGGFLVNEIVHAEITDLSRPLSVVMRLGAQHLAMLSESVSIARLKTDAVMRTKAENAAWALENLAFSVCNLLAKIFGCVAGVSGELLQDAAPTNFATAMQTFLARSHAQQLDRTVLCGAHDGDDDPLLGAFNKPSSPGDTDGVQTITSIGTPTNYDKLLDAIQKIESVNGAATGIVCGSAVRRRYRGLVQGDGTNSPLTYQAVHPDIATLPWLTSEQSESGCMYIGDWSKIIIGERLAPTIQMSDTAGDAFEKYQTLFRIVWRGDVAVERANHLVRLSGIS